MRIASVVLTLAVALAIALPEEASARRGASVWRTLKHFRKVPVRQPSMLGDFAVGAASGAAGAWMYDQMSEPEKGGEECIDCRKPYRERKELEERCKTAKSEP